MKKFLLSVSLCFLILQVFSSELVLFKISNYEQTQSLLNNPNLTVHFYSSQLAIATAKNDVGSKAVVLESNPWRDSISYYLVYYNRSVDFEGYLKAISNQAQILYQGDTFIIVSTNEVKFGQLPPAKNDGMVRIHNIAAVLPSQSFPLVQRSIDPVPFVTDRLNEVVASNITATVQQLQNYGTRDAYHSLSVVAQQWIASQFQLLGLSVEVMDFTMPGGPASDNVIATLTGTKYPNEYVVVGGHYDSRSSSSSAPGADDNASGTAAVLEIARILSSYPLDRSVIFCAFSGEEYGLYGSSAFAARSRQEGKVIMGYFNLDMIGYLQFGNSIITTLIYPQSAQPLATFYTQVCSAYLPEFIIQTGTLTGGDSDHTSFNQNGYMGIFPFENINAYSPYIHTTNDVVGISYNNENQAAIFTKASLASLITLANWKMPPQGLTATPHDGLVGLTWNAMFEIDHYKIYRNGQHIATLTDNAFEDNTVTNFTQYTYYVTAVFSDSGEESAPSNEVKVTPVPPITLPLLLNFENGTPYWNLESNWGTTSTASYSPSYSLSESPSGTYQNSENSIAQLTPFSLKGYNSATLSFWTKYDLENNYDYMYLETSTNGTNWSQLAVYNGNQSAWAYQSYSLNAYLNQANVFVRFRFTSDNSIKKDGMYIDDFQVAVTGPGYKTQNIEIPQGWSGISSYVAPENTSITHVLGSNTNAVSIVQNLSSAYSPILGLNTLTTWDVNSGYIVKSSEPVSISITGLAKENGTLSLTQGWNLVPVFSRSHVDAESLFGGILDKLVMAKQVAGNAIYWPSMQIETLTQFESGKSYFVFVNEDCQITYPILGNKSDYSTNTENDFPWQVTDPKPHSHVILFPSSCLQQLEVGDYIGGFTPSGECVGAIQIEDLGMNYALVLYSNDIITENTDGFLPSDLIRLRVFSSASQTERSIVANYSNQMPNTSLFANEGISMVNSFEFEGNSVVTHNFGVSVFPNPAKDYIVIEESSGVQCAVQIYSALGLPVYTGELNGGIQVSTASWTSGIYFIKITCDQRQITKRIVVRK